jgi:hypothetical protein
LSKDLVVSRGAENVNAKICLGRKLKQLQNIQQDAIKKKILQDGRIRYYKDERSSKTIGRTSGSSYIVEYNPAT